MEIVYRALLTTHIVAGGLSLILFWIPVFTRKGKKNHRLIGRVYVYSMTLVVGSAGLLSLYLVAYKNLALGLILGFLAWLTLQPLWSGVNILKHKKTDHGRYSKMQWVFSSVTLVYGLGLLYAWSGSMDTGFLIFGAIGTIAGGLGTVGPVFRKKDTPWLKEHYNNMLFTGAAAYTAFLAFGVRSFLPVLQQDLWGILPWIAPSLIAALAVVFLDRRFLARRASSS